MSRASAAILLMITASLTATPGSSGQEPVQYDARAGVTLMRAINTAEPALVSSVFERELTPPASMEHRLGIGAMVPAFIGLSSILGWRDRRPPDRSQDHAITSS